MQSSLGRQPRGPRQPLHDIVAILAPQTFAAFTVSTTERQASAGKTLLRPSSGSVANSPALSDPL